MLANQIWSLGGDDDASDVVNQTFLQPFLQYALGHGRSLSLNTESTYDWDTEEWTVPINLGFQPGDETRSSAGATRDWRTLLCG